MRLAGSRRRWWPLLLVIGVALIAIGGFYFSVALRWPDPDPMREPRFMVTTLDAPSNIAGQLMEIPGFVNVRPARESDLESMYLDSDQVLNLGTPFVLVVDNDADLDLIREQTLKIPGVNGYSQRTGFGGTWRVGDANGGAWYDRKGLIIYVWPLVFAVPGLLLVLLALRWMGHMRGGSAPVV